MKKGFIAILSVLAGGAAGAGAAVQMMSKKTKQQKEYADKHLNLYLLMNQWVKVKQDNKSMADYLKEEGFKEIAIYGMNYVGETLLKELQDSGIDVKYGIDKNANSICSDIHVVTPEEELETVDAVIVTAVTYFYEIDESLSNKIDCPILSLEDILYEL